MFQHWLGRGLARILSLLALAGLLVSNWGVGYAALFEPRWEAETSPGPTQPPPGERTRQGVTDAQAPLISFIDGPSPTCTRPQQGTDVCFIQWNSLGVTAGTSQYVISMTVKIDGRPRAYMAGFFQTSMSVPYDMLTPGFQVACGVPGAAGIPTLGNAYSYEVRARDTQPLEAANYGTVYCPPDLVALQAVTVIGPASGLVNQGYSFSAAVQPMTATLPLTYTWSSTGLVTQKLTGTLTSTVNLQWPTPGLKQIYLEVQNQASVITSTASIQIYSRNLYLPYIRK